jgi:hypothetical protein
MKKVTIGEQNEYQENSSLRWTLQAVAILSEESNIAITTAAHTFTVIGTNLRVFGLAILFIWLATLVL